MKGHIRERRPGVWQVLVDVGPDPVTGRRRQRSRTIHGTRVDAETERDRLVEEIRADLFVDDRVTVADFADRFYRRHVRTLEPTTAEWYRHMLAYVTRSMGKRHLSQVKWQTLEMFYDSLLERGGKDGRPLSPTTVQGVHKACKVMFEQAVKWEYLSKNPADLAAPPKGRTPEQPSWTADQLARFLEGTQGERFHVAFAMLALTGMRRGELAGLEWSAVDLTAGSITVTQTVRNVAGRAVPGGPKTASGRRTIALDGVTVELLRAWRKAQLEEQLAAEGNQGWVHVVTWPDGRPVHPDVLTRTFKRWCGRLDLPYPKLHGLRHTWSTLAAQAGVHPSVAQRRVGHSSPVLTLGTYTHVVSDQDRDAAEAVARRVWR